MIGPILNGIQGFGQVFVLASAFYLGTEIVSLTAGETKDPMRSISQVSSTSCPARQDMTLADIS